MTELPPRRPPMDIEVVDLTSAARPNLLDAIAPAGSPSWLLTSPTATAALALYRTLGWDELTPTSDGAHAGIAVFATPLPPGDGRR